MIQIMITEAAIDHLVSENGADREGAEELIQALLYRCILDVSPEVSLKAETELRRSARDMLAYIDLFEGASVGIGISRADPAFLVRVRALRKAIEEDETARVPEGEGSRVDKLKLRRDIRSLISEHEDDPDFESFVKGPALALESSLDQFFELWKEEK